MKTSFTRSLTFRVALAGVVLLLATAFSYWRWIRPLEIRHAETAQHIGDVDERIRRAEREMLKLKDRQEQGSSIRRSLSALHYDVPADPPIVWLPSRLQSLLDRLGVMGVSVRPNKTTPERLLPGFDRTYWLASVPTQSKTRKFSDILLAVAQIEQQDNFIQIEALSLQVDAQEPGGTAGYLNLTAFLPR